MDESREAKALTMQIKVDTSKLDAILAKFAREHGDDLFKHAVDQVLAGVHTPQAFSLPMTGTLRLDPILMPATLEFIGRAWRSGFEEVQRVIEPLVDRLCSVYWIFDGEKLDAIRYPRYFHIVNSHQERRRRRLHNGRLPKLQRVRS